MDININVNVNFNGTITHEFTGLASGVTPAQLKSAIDGVQTQVDSLKTNLPTQADFAGLAATKADMDMLQAAPNR